MYCKHCGKEISDLAAICVNCGAKTTPPTQSTEDHGGAGWWWLGFLVPLAGLLIWIFCQNTQPQRSKSAGTGALIGFCVSIGLYIFFWIIWFFLMVFA